jgi:hypothetical protein
MRTFLSKLLDSARKYTIMDYGFLKITLISFGILLGTYFSKFFSSYTILLWIIFIVSYIYIIYRTIKHID